MILTVTLNSALDRVLFIDEWTPGISMRVKKVVTSVGGKGLDASVVLSHLGIDTVGLCLVAGDAGRKLVSLCESYGIRCDPVWVDGETRISNVVAEMNTSRHSHLMEGEIIVSPQHLAEFKRHLRLHAGETPWIICGGSIPPSVPPDTYRDVTQIAAEAGARVLIDAACEYVMLALPSRPAIVKMNQNEFAATFGVESKTLAELKQHAMQVYRDYDLTALVLTCASDGLLAFCTEGSYDVWVPRQTAVNAAGAGDAVSAVLAWKLSIGETWDSALRWAGATGAATVLTEGTADCRMEDVLRIYEQVVVSRI